MKKIILLFTLAFFGNNLFAQPILRHEQSSEINDMLPTPTGDSVWLATDGGIELITSFGSNINIFHTSFEVHSITSIGKVMWFGGKDSIARYDGSQWTFFKGSGLPASFTVDDIKAVNGVVWVVANKQLYRMLGGGFIDMNREASRIVPAAMGNRFFLMAKNRFGPNVEYVNGNWSTLPNSMLPISEAIYINQTLWGLTVVGSVVKFNRVSEEWEEPLNNHTSIKGIVTVDGAFYIYKLERFWEIDPWTETAVDSFSITYNFMDRIDDLSAKSRGARVVLKTSDEGLVELFLDAARGLNKPLDLNSFELPVGPTGVIGRNSFFFDDVKVDNKPVLFVINPWISGVIDDMEFSNAPQYAMQTKTFVSGPISDVHDKEYIEKYNRVWKVNRDQIEQHKQNFANSNYSIPDDIETWPGNGDHTKGESFNLAPFVDVNGNGIYEPEQGDYPDILGHQAVYTITNNFRQNQYVGGNFDHRSRKLEVHLMMYAFDSIEVPELDKTVYLNYRVFNRGNSTWENAKFSLFNDWGMHDPTTSVCGSDSIENLFFGYNISDNDLHFGTKPVAVVGTLLNQPLEGHMFFYRSDFINIHMSGPRSTSDVINLTNFRWNPFAPLVRKTPSGPNSNDNGTGFSFDTTGAYPTKWAFNSPDNWYYPPAEMRDVRSLAVTEMGDVQPGEHRCLEFAYTHGFDETDFTGTWQTALARARNQMNTAKSVYDNLNTGCLGAVLSNETFDHNRMSFELYPNPIESGRTLRINTTDRINTITMVSVTGSLIPVEVKSMGNGYDVDIPEYIASGAYILRIQTAHKGLVVEKLLVK